MKELEFIIEALLVNLDVWSRKYDQWQHASLETDEPITYQSLADMLRSSLDKTKEKFEKKIENQQKLFIVWDGEYEHRDVVGIFSSGELAIKFIKEIYMKSIYLYHYDENCPKFKKYLEKLIDDIQEIVLDEGR